MLHQKKQKKHVKCLNLLSISKMLKEELSPNTKLKLKTLHLCNKN